MLNSIKYAILGAVCIAVLACGTASDSEGEGKEKELIQLPIDPEGPCTGSASLQAIDAEIQIVNGVCTLTTEGQKYFQACLPRPSDGCWCCYTEEGAERSLKRSFGGG